jgi:AGZA family xanthine/uracil permease-like MFS transporter
MSAAAQEAPPPPRGNAIEEYFKFAERGTNFATETRAGLTTFMVMAYIIFLNGSILMGGFKDADGAFTAVALAAGTALIAGIMTIAMGVVGNYPLALAAGLGINGIVAFSLTAQGLSPAGAMGVILLEGLLVTLLVVVGFREAVMNAVPLALKRSIGAGIGLFILFIGFANGGFVVANAPATPVTFHLPSAPADFVFWIGVILTVGLWVLKIRAALVISILVTTVVAIIAGVQALPADLGSLIATPSFSTLGHVDPLQVFQKLPFITALLIVFSIMLTDFFDTMGTVTGVASEAGLAREDGSVPGIGRVLIVDSLAAVVGGAAGVSSNTTYIESAAGVAEGGKTGFASVVTGILFLLAIFLSPIALLIPGVATAPALILVGYLMFTQVKGIDIGDVEDGIPALLTMILMPLTYDISVGIGAGFISWVVIKLLRGKAAEIHPLMWVVAVGFVVFFMQDWIVALLPK